MGIIRKSLIVMYGLWSFHAFGNEINIELIGGQVSKDYPAIVELSPVGCTATIIGPHAIITAGHCYSTGQTARFSQNGVVYSAKMSRNPKYSDSSATNDHTLGYVAEEIPPPYMPISNLSPTSGQAVLLTGYGCIKPRNWFGGGATGADHKLRVGESKIQSVSSLEFVTKGNGVALCFGDSGGPVLDASHKHLLGINSKGNIRDTSWLARVDIGWSFFQMWALGNDAHICGVTTTCDSM